MGGIAVIDSDAALFCVRTLLLILISQMVVRGVCR
jgi:hypothetical protein